MDDSRIEAQSQPDVESTLICDDLLKKVESLLSSEELILFHRRRSGQSWQSISLELSVDPAILRQ